MREIKFRGKRLDNNEWVYGRNIQFQIDGTDKVCISKTGSQRWLDPDTVGQFTGFYDRKGQEIYESDIITYLSHRMDGTGIIEQGKVEWRQEEGCYVFVNRFSTRDNRVMVTPLIRCKEITVIGNLFDNPELMEGGSQ